MSLLRRTLLRKTICSFDKSKYIFGECNCSPGVSTDKNKWTILNYMDNWFSIRHTSKNNLCKPFYIFSILLSIKLCLRWREQIQKWIYETSQKPNRRLTGKSFEENFGKPPHGSLRMYGAKAEMSVRLGYRYPWAAECRILRSLFQRAVSIQKA